MEFPDCLCFFTLLFGDTTKGGRDEKMLQRKKDVGGLKERWQGKSERQKEERKKRGETKSFEPIQTSPTQFCMEMEGREGEKRSEFSHHQIGARGMGHPQRQTSIVCSCSARAYLGWVTNLHLKDVRNQPREVLLIFWCSFQANISMTHLLLFSISLKASICSSATSYCPNCFTKPFSQTSGWLLCSRTWEQSVSGSLEAQSETKASPPPT